MNGLSDNFGAAAEQFLAWSVDYELGHPEIDAEHRALFELVSRLAAAVTGVGPWEVAADLTDRLASETRQHFDEEEHRMREVGYPDWQHHHEQHTELLLQLDYLRDRLKAEHYLTRPHKTLRFLQDWFLIHIARSDRSFVDFLKANPAP